MYLIISWWRGSIPDQEPRDCLPQIEEVEESSNAKEKTLEKALRKKRRLGPQSKVKVFEAQLVEEL